MLRLAGPGRFIPFWAFILSASLSGQTAGGEWYRLHHYSGTHKGDHFGNSVANVGDVNQDGWLDWAVGAPGEEGPNGSVDAGIARVFSGKTGRVIYEWSGVNNFDHFGVSVGRGKDTNSDGHHDILVGANWMDTNGMHENGSAFLYSGKDGSLLYQWNGEHSGDGFGFSVHTADDFNADGYADVLIGAPWADSLSSGDPDTGAIYVFSGFDGSLLMRIEGESPNDMHGQVVTGIGDLDGDGTWDFLAGSRYSIEQGKRYAGSVIAYSGMSGQVIFRISGANPYDYLGTSILRIGDINWDGVRDFAAGAPGTDSNGPDAGAVYIYSGVDGTLIRAHSGLEAGDFFGGTIAGLGDLDRDYVMDYAIGADHADSEDLENSGAVSFFSGADGRPLERFTGPHEHAYFGRAISGLGNFIANQQKGILIGTEWSDSGGLEDCGSVDLYCYDPYLYGVGDVLHQGYQAVRIDVSDGGLLEFEIDFPEEAAGYEYRLILSRADPASTMFRGILIPLAMDTWAINSWHGVFPGTGVFDSFQGTLNAEGKATARFGVAPGKLEPWRVYRVAAVALHPGSEVPAYSSGVIPILTRD